MSASWVRARRSSGHGEHSGSLGTSPRGPSPTHPGTRSPRLALPRDPGGAGAGAWPRDPPLIGRSWRGRGAGGHSPAPGRWAQDASHEKPRGRRRRQQPEPEPGPPGEYSETSPRGEQPRSPAGEGEGGASSKKLLLPWGEERRVELQDGKQPGRPRPGAQPLYPAHGHRLRRRQRRRPGGFPGWRHAPVVTSKGPPESPGSVPSFPESSSPQPSPFPPSAEPQTGAPLIGRPQTSVHLAQPESPVSGQGRAAGGEPEPAQRPGPAELSEPIHGAPAPRISSPDAQSSSERRAQEDPYSVTLEPPQTPGDSGAGAAGGSSHLQEISGSPSSRARGPARCSQLPSRRWRIQGKKVNDRS
ncbi:basic salivary proline-rich protein 1-like [Alexandromys fortis]|uniref:basic salivary proline-rich protein 1-like n=1 Tax=Alexandromys fortis TaxID=100897 RepID=UPI002152FC10|nr:basic salivary proline-rich protein 1-like [Microtus fortis]